MWKPLARLMISSLSLHVSWKPVNPQECVWKNLYRNIMRTISQEKVTIHYSIRIWFTNLFLCLKQWRYPQQKRQWTKNGRNLKRFRRGKWRKSATNLKWLMKQEKKVEKYTSLHWWTSVIWRMPNWRQSTKNTKVELYSEATLWKMIPDLMQYLQNKDHQHPKWQQPKVMDIISRLSGCDGQAADAVSAYTQVKMEGAPKLVKISKSECPDIWIRLPRHKWPKSWSSMEDPVVPLERNLYGHPLAGPSWERQFEKILLKHGWEKIPNWECLFVHREKGLFLSVYVDDIKIGWKETKSWSDVEST